MIDDVAGHDKHLSEFPVPLLPRPREQSVHRNLLKLAFRVLVEAADADIADALTLQDASKGKSVRMKSITFDGICQSIGNLILF